MNKRRILYIILFLIALLLFYFSCGRSNKSTFFSFNRYEDGIYCAEINYYNPSTGTRSNYILNVSVQNKKLAVIYWPNGGWLDNSHFIPTDISDGDGEFISDRNVHYRVQLIYSGYCNYDKNK